VSDPDVNLVEKLIVSDPGWLCVIFTYYYTPPKPHFWTRVPISCQKKLLQE